MSVRLLLLPTATTMRRRPPVVATVAKGVDALPLVVAVTSTRPDAAMPANCETTMPCAVVGWVTVMESPLCSAVVTYALRTNVRTLWFYCGEAITMIRISVMSSMA